MQTVIDLLAQGDPHRYRAALAAPVAARPMLFAVYAANIEIARAPWAAHDPMLAHMRLQWWADTIAGVQAGEVRAHPVAQALAAHTRTEDLRFLIKATEARLWDCQRGPFDDLAHMRHYLRDTAMGTLGVTTQGRAPAALAEAVGWARFMAAQKALTAHGVRDVFAHIPPKTLHTYAAAQVDGYRYAWRGLMREAGLIEAVGHARKLRTIARTGAHQKGETPLYDALARGLYALRL